MRFAQTFIAAALLAFAAAQDAAAPPPPTGTIAPPSPAEQSQCAAAISACPTPNGSCISNLCSSCSKMVPCCAAPQASQEACFSSQASSASSIAAITDPASLTSSVACVVANQINVLCAAAATGFPQEPASQRASCLCYQHRQSSSVWAPAFFDAAISNCAGFLAASGPPSAAAAASSDIGLCSKAGNIRSLPAVSANPTGSSSPAETGSSGATGTGAGTGSTEPNASSGAPESTSKPVPTTNAGSAAVGLSKTTMTLAGTVLAVLGFVFSL